MPTHDEENGISEDSPARGLVFSIERMRRVDAYAIKELGIPGVLLMEHAAIALRERSDRLAGRAAPVIVLAGPGNNGGDGLALARLLHIADPERSIRCVLLGGDDLSGDARTNLGALRRLSEHSETLSVDEQLPPAPTGPGLVVDAMFGSGLSRPLRGVFAEAVRWCVERQTAGWKVLAVDVPSGLNADTGRPVEGDDTTASPIIRADETVTLGGMKVGLRNASCSEWAGKVTVGEIGVPRWVLERFGEPIEGTDQG
jgi:NAD(P)H-hydrate epimerase